MLQTIGKQFKQPKGFLGKIISKLMQKTNNFAYDILLNEMSIKNNENIFEIGYGHGVGIKKTLSEADCFISGIDFSELMYKEAAKRNKKNIENKKVKLFFGNFINYDLKSNEYDKIFCLNVVYFWDELEKPFRKIRKGLKDNGVFYFFMEHQDKLHNLKFAKDDIFNKYSIEEVKEKLKLSGFSKIDYHYKKGYFVRCEK